jgi:hypothetical protein
MPSIIKYITIIQNVYAQIMFKQYLNNLNPIEIHKQRNHLMHASDKGSILYLQWIVNNLVKLCNEK